MNWSRPLHRLQLHDHLALHDEIRPEASIDDEVRAAAGYPLQAGAATHQFDDDTLGRLRYAYDPDIGPRLVQWDDRGWITRAEKGAGDALVPSP